VFGNDSAVTFGSATATGTVLVSSTGETVGSNVNMSVAGGTLRADPAQHAILPGLEDIRLWLEEQAARPKGGLRSLFRKPPAPPKGLYLWGGVGRGKSMLMDLFYGAVDIPAKRRVHFHAFMADIHTRLHSARTDSSLDDIDPIEYVAKEISSEVKLLCFDEFIVNDIADATILARLFSHLFISDMIIVATSNVEPKRLYEDGRNRELFLPFIEIMKNHMEVVHITSQSDYRLQDSSINEIYFVPADDLADKALDQLFYTLSGQRSGVETVINIKKREITIPEACNKTARFNFTDICGQPLAAMDYAEIIKSFNAIIIANIPILKLENQNEARRLITLIDIIYENRSLLAMSAEAEPASLYQAAHGNEARDFKRTASRIAEMRTRQYLDHFISVHRLKA
jgi:cell division protein ZapE